MVLTADDIIAALPALSAVDLAKIKARVQILLKLGAGGEAPTKDELNHDFLLDGIESVLKSRGLLTRLPLPSRRSSIQAFAQYAKKRPELVGFLEPTIAPLQKRELMVLGTIMASALAAYIQQYLPVNLSTMLVSIDKLPEAFEHSFPGYIRNRLVQWLLMQGRNV